MTAKEVKLTAALLEMASNEFSNHGSNDMDKALLNAIGFTDEEKLALAREFHEWNGDLEEILEDGELSLREFNWIGDSCWMDFMAAKLSKEAPSA